MSIEVGFWRLGDQLEKVEFSPMDSENRLEDVLAKDLSIVDQGLMLIGRQVLTSYGKLVDLLAINGEGSLVVLELKRNRTPREVVAQLLDYGSWVRELDDAEIAGIFEKFLAKHDPARAGTSLDDAFCEHFDASTMPEDLNQAHELMVVAGELDDSTERIIDYLAEEFGVPINAVFFRFFKDGQNEYLSRAWLLDPVEVEARVEEKREKGQWNGEFYVSFGHSHSRDWEDAQKFGFISAGGGQWYSRTLTKLEPGARIWVNLPGHGYAGVGIVVEGPVPFDRFEVDDGKGNRVPITSMPLKGSYHVEQAAEDSTKAEYLVRVRWLKTVPVNEAIREKGFFGNQNSAAKPKTKSWQHTVERLTQRFGIAGDMPS